MLTEAVLPLGSFRGGYVLLDGCGLDRTTRARRCSAPKIEPSG